MTVETGKRRVHGLVSGRVQGVGYRGSMEAAATERGLVGWVRNLPDGRVEALVEGDAEAVTRVERALRMGPPSARVDTVAVDSEDAAGAYIDFSIR